MASIHNVPPNILCALRICKAYRHHCGGGSELYLGQTSSLGDPYLETTTRRLDPHRRDIRTVLDLERDIDPRAYELHSDLRQLVQDGL